jgi:hypothetical protein
LEFYPAGPIPMEKYSTLQTSEMWMAFLTICTSDRLVVWEMNCMVLVRVVPPRSSSTYEERKEKKKERKKEKRRKKEKKIKKRKKK